MKYANIQAAGLIGALALTGALAGCGSSTTDAGGVVSTALTVTGQIKASGGSLMRAVIGDDYASRIDIGNLPTYSMATDLTTFALNCVSYTIPPVAGTGGTLDASGNFKVTFPEGTKSVPFGCFLWKPADATFDPITLNFVDTTKTDLAGSSKKSARFAPSDDITISELAVDLDAKTAEVVLTKVVATNDPTKTGDTVQAQASGTKFDFTGEYRIESAVANGITLPDGYKDAMSLADQFTNMKQYCGKNGGGGGGPMQGMSIWLMRLDGKAYTITDKTACEAAKQAAFASGSADFETLKSNPACAGTTGTDDLYGITLWSPNESGFSTVFGSQMAGVCNDTVTPAQAGANVKAAFEALSAKTNYTDCGSVIGFGDGEAKLGGGIVLTPNSTWSFGNYTFPNSIDMTSAGDKDDIFGDGKPLKLYNGTDYTSAITEDWKFTQAQNQWSQGACYGDKVTIGTKTFNGWRCDGNYDGGTANAYRINVGRGCYLSDSTGTTVGAPIMFANMWNSAPVGDAKSHFYFDGSHCNGTPSDCPQNFNLTTIDGQTLPTGWWGNKNWKNFIPKDNQGNFLIASGDHSGWVTCENYGANLQTSDNQPIANFDYTKWTDIVKGAANTLCSAMAHSTDEERLTQLRCYANAYWRMNEKISTYGKYNGSAAKCSPEIRFNEGTTNSWEFVRQNGPKKAKGQFITELFTYMSNTSGAFTTEQVEGRGIQTKNTMGGDSWINCQIRRNESFSITAIGGNTNKLLIDYTSVANLMDKNNPACVAKIDELGVGTEKMLFVMSKI